LDWAADLEDALGSPAQASEFRGSAASLRRAIRERYWDATRQLFADTPRKDTFSQQAHALAVLAHLVDGEEARALVIRVLGDSAAPGFAHVVIRPYLGALTRASGSIPQPKGEIAVKLERKGTGLDAEVTLPPGITGRFVWHGAEKTLAAGRTTLRYP